MLIGVIADDFTGASDIAITLARGFGINGGLRTVQYLGIPADDAGEDVEAGVVSLKIRSVPVPDAIEQARRALAWLTLQGCEQIVYKYCSTFDSTPEGNIGPVSEMLAQELGEKGVVACPALPAVGRTVYQGHLFVHDRLLHQSGMENHPLNPMTDPDIRRWLKNQTQSEVGHLGIGTVRRGDAAIVEGLDAAAAEGQVLCIVDAIDDDDLLAIGRSVRGRRLITGGSGIALGLPSNFISRGLASGRAPAMPDVDGAGAVLAGSCSIRTQEQVKHYSERHPAIAIDVASVIEGQTTADHVADFLLRHQGQTPLAYSSQTPETVRAVQQAYGRDTVSNALDRLFAETAVRLVDAGVRRLVVAGGETSGAVVSALRLGHLEIGPEIEPGVPVLTSSAQTPVGLALKSGNFGSIDFFERAQERLAGR
ncbi:four-carbon acid sugar kinase family protein [Agrobacterium rhizogenes]|uniref:3-oxo-tetronate kinase n=1 Tax=Rhizobium rhizogenes TaxID=359 RepID=UPI0022B6789F|nr:3-oxo-tetronate kinase [Rhizobium rhizogenes]MCZ7447264.1 four-carbon acid sugar kinase family protein [Rhizobium rhizogenes]